VGGEEAARRRGGLVTHQGDRLLPKRGGREDALDGVEERVDVGPERLVVDPHRVAPREALQRGGQLVAMRHRRAVDQHRHHADAALEGGGDLQHDEVVGIIQPATACVVRHRRPGLADQDDEDVTGAFPRCAASRAAGS